MSPAILFVLLSFAPLFSPAQGPTAVTASSAQKATIVFFREKHTVGSGLRPSVYLDGMEVERLSNGRWFSIEVEPGKHELGSSAKHEPHTIIEIEPGEIAYVQMIIATGTWRGGGRLLQVDPKQAEGVMRKLKPLHGDENQQ